MSIIQNGSGNGGYNARVDKDSRLWVDSITNSFIVRATNLGDGFNLHTGRIDFTTSTTQQGLMYFKNNVEGRDFIIDTFIVGFGSAGTMSDVGYCEFWRNPTGGTLITDANDCPGANRKTSSNRDLGSSVCYSASAEGKTLTGGKFLGAIQCGSGQRAAAAGLNVEIGRGDSFAFTVDPSTTAGTTKIYGVIIGYYKDSVGIA